MGRHVPPCFSYSTCRSSLCTSLIVGRRAPTVLVTFHSRWLPITLSSGSSDGLSLPLRNSGQPRALSTDALGLLLGSKSVTALVVMLIESAAELAEHLRAEADRYAAILAFEPEKSITCVSVPGHG